MIAAHAGMHVATDVTGLLSAATQVLPVNGERLVDIGQKDRFLFGAIEDTVLRYKLAKGARVVDHELQIASNGQ